jgi:hypothetical protein
MLSDSYSVRHTAREVSYLLLCYWFIAYGTLYGILRIITSRIISETKTGSVKQTHSKLLGYASTQFNYTCFWI